MTPASGWKTRALFRNSGRRWRPPAQRDFCIPELENDGQRLRGVRIEKLEIQILGQTGFRWRDHHNRFRFDIEQTRRVEGFALKPVGNDWRALSHAHGFPYVRRKCQHGDIAVMIPNCLRLAKRSGEGLGAFQSGLTPGQHLHGKLGRSPGPAAAGTAAKAAK